MSDPDESRAERASPVGRPVVRGDRAVTGDRADRAVEFDPEDPADLQRAARTVEAFATETGGGDNVYVLRGAAAAAALVRGEGSYRAAARRVEAASVSFIRKWARVHDLPRSIRRQVATGRLAPSAAKHVARLEGDARLSLAWATVDHDLTVREVRSVASAVLDGRSVEAALAEVGADLGEVTVELPPEAYRELRRRAALDGVSPGEVVADALEGELFDGGRSG